MQYSETLAQMLRVPTVSVLGQDDPSLFYEFHDLLRRLFPHIFSVCTFEDFNGSFLMCWKGQGNGKPVMFMNHHDVVSANGEWKYPPFSGTIAEGKVWGRGALDTKGGLLAMLQAGDELATAALCLLKAVFRFGNGYYPRSRRSREHNTYCRHVVFAAHGVVNPIYS